MVNMRDSIRSKEYFDTFIEEDSKRIKNFTNKLNLGQVPAERISIIKERVTSLELGVFIARYSRGDELIELSKSFSPLFDSWTGTFNKNNYDVNLKMVSLSVLFNFEKELSKIESNLLEIDDWLINARRSEKHGQRLPDTNKQHPQAGCVRLSSSHPTPPSSIALPLSSSLK